MEDRKSDLQSGARVIKFEPGRPMEIPEGDSDSSSIPDDRRRIGKPVTATVAAYLKAAQELLKGKYAHIKEYAPPHLRNPGIVVVFCLADGILIRYDSNPDQQQLKVAAAYSDGSLPDLAPTISETVVHCHASHDWQATYPPSGPEIALNSVDGTTGVAKVIWTAKISYHTVIERPTREVPSPPAKPYSLLSVRNSFELGLVGEMLTGGQTLGNGRPFMTRTPMRLPVGWECIEVFPFPDPEQWKPEYARIWAENDLLAAVLAHHLREAQYNTLDPMASARQQLSALLGQYKELLDSDPDREEVLQSFLKDNPVLVCPTHTKMWPKLALGAHNTDFVFREGPADYLLVELEKSTRRLFLKDGDASKELRHAQDQVADWKRYIEDNPSTVRTELGLTGISSNPRSLIVIGRSSALAPENRRKLQTFENQSPKDKIMTYDDLFENTKTIIDNLLGPLWTGVGNTRVYYPPNK